MTDVTHIDLTEELELRAASYDQSGPSAAHTATMLREAAAAITRLRAERDAETKRANEAEASLTIEDKAGFALVDELRAAEAERDAAVKRAEDWKALYQMADQSRDEWMGRAAVAESCTKQEGGE